MFTIKGYFEIKTFLSRYMTLENPHKHVRLFLDALDRKGLLSCVEILYSDVTVRENNHVMVYPNGVVTWEGLQHFDRIYEDCLAYIEREANVRPVVIQLYSRHTQTVSDMQREAIRQGETVGEFANRIRRMEEEEEVREKRKQARAKKAQNGKEVAFNRILDRYNDQKNLYEWFGDARYLRRMKRWERVFASFRKQVNEVECGRLHR